MPKPPQVQRDEIFRAAFEITVERGIEAATATAIAERLGCSISPVYSTYRTMENMEDAIIEKAMEKYSEFLRTETSEPSRTGAIGYNYFLFAQDYPHLFRLIFINARQKVKDNTRESMKKNRELAVSYIQETYKIDNAKAQDIYVKVGLICQGIAFGVAFGTATLSNDDYKRHIDEILQKLLA